MNRRAPRRPQSPVERIWRTEYSTTVRLGDSCGGEASHFRLANAPDLSEGQGQLGREEPSQSPSESHRAISQNPSFGLPTACASKPDGIPFFSSPFHFGAEAIAFVGTDRRKLQI